MKKRMISHSTYLLWIAMIGILFLSGGCRKEERMKETETIAFRDLAADINNCHIQDMDDKEFIFISNIEQLEKHIICDEIQWTIDFDTEFVIAGKINLPNYPSVLTSQELGIEEGKLNYVLNIDMGSATQPSAIYFMSAVPKKYSKMQVEVNTQIN